LPAHFAHFLVFLFGPNPFRLSSLAQEEEEEEEDDRQTTTTDDDDDYSSPGVVAAGLACLLVVLWPSERASEGTFSSVACLHA
jgi:hypothetical protein